MKCLVRGALAVLAITMAFRSSVLAQTAPHANAPMRPGDRLLVKIWLDTTFADTVRIDEAGSAVLPRLGAVNLSGVGALGVADSVRRAYSRVIRTPSIEVTPLRRVTVIGEVKKPATYYLETRATIREAIAIANGVTDIGQPGRAVVIRDSSRTVFENWAQRGDEAVVVQSGDVIWIDREPWIKRNAISAISGLGVLVSIIYTLRR